MQEIKKRTKAEKWHGNDWIFESIQIVCILIVVCILGCIGAYID